MCITSRKFLQPRDRGIFGKSSSSSSSSSAAASALWPRRVRTAVVAGCPRPAQDQRFNRASTTVSALATAAYTKETAGNASSGLRTLYPQLAPCETGLLKVSDVHTLHYEVYGNPKGVAAVVVHGGPGAGCFANHARFFDPAHYRIILVDQRGCGRSTPYGCLVDNTTAHLVSDLEALRKALHVQQWVMLGGSWGCTLTLAYAQAYPAAVLGIVLRGVCLMRPQELHWMFGGGAAALKPLGWSRFLQPLAPEERQSPLLSYYKRMLSQDGRIRTEAAKSWTAWEMAVGFSSAETVIVCNGEQRSEQTASSLPVQTHAPQQQQPHATTKQAMQPPPKPMGQVAATGSSSTDVTGPLQQLPRDITGSSWFSTLQQHKQECTPTNPGNVMDTSILQHDTAIPGNLQTPRHRKGGPTAMPDAAGAFSSIACTDHSHSADQQPAELQHIVFGLQHRGFKEHSHAQALLEAHYSVHAAFLLQQPILQHIDWVRHIPCIAVQGQWDLVCPPTTAVELSAVWPEMELRLVARAGHSMYDPAITHQLVMATDRMKALQASTLSFI